MGRGAGRSRQEPAGARHQFRLLQPPPTSPWFGGTPRPGGGSGSSSQPPTEASSCTGSPRAPQRITALGCGPHCRSREEDEDAYVPAPAAARSPQERRQMRAQHHTSEDRGLGAPPKIGFQPHRRE